jgi:hypothetical protein
MQCNVIVSVQVLIGAQGGPPVDEVSGSKTLLIEPSYVTEGTYASEQKDCCCEDG